MENKCIKKVSRDAIKDCFANCGVSEQATSIASDENADEEFNNLYKELTEKPQIDNDIAADEIV